MRPNMKFHQYVDFPGSKDADYSQFSRELFTFSQLTTEQYTGHGGTIEIMDAEGNYLQRVCNPEFTFDFEGMLRLSGFVHGKKSGYEDVSYRFYTSEHIAARTGDTRFVKAKLYGAVSKLKSKEKK